LAAQLLDMEARLPETKDSGDWPAAALDLAGFALTRVVEGDLTRVWLLRRSAARPDRALRALTIAGQALFEADQLPQRSGVKALDPPDAARLRRLRVLLAVEKTLLSYVDAAEALRAATRADDLLVQVPAPARPAWDLLVAACLEKAAKREDALLRLQQILRHHRGSPAGTAAAILQAHILADAGSHAAAVALLAEYGQAIPSLTAEPADSGSTSGAEVKVTGMPEASPRAKLVQCTLMLLRADLAAKWADKLGQSAGHMDRQTAVQLREQAAGWHAQAEELGPHMFRLLAILRPLDLAAGN